MCPDGFVVLCRGAAIGEIRKRGYKLTSPKTDNRRNRQDRLTLMKIVIYLFFLITCVALTLVIFRLTRGALRTISKSLYIHLDMERKVKTFKSWLDQNSNQ